MNKEIDALSTNGTWNIVVLPPGKRVNSCKWIYKIKLKADGSIERSKVRLVAKDFTQQHGIDYYETFSPIIKMSSVRCILVVPVSQGWPMFQLDVNNVFLHGDLQEEVYMKLPQGFDVPTGSIYDYVLVAIYVDDILLTGSNLKAIGELKIHLHNVLTIKDLGFLNYFLGFEITRTQDHLTMTQCKFVHDLLTDSGMDFATKTLKSYSNPLPLNTKLVPDQGELLDDPGSMLGKLNFLTNTKPDLSFSVQTLSILIQGSTKLQLTAFSYSNWAGCPTTRRSVNGYIIKLGQTPISWKSKKQSTVSRSSVEAEYRAMTWVVVEVTWLVRLLADLGLKDLQPVTLHCDNSSAMHIARNPVFHECTKHIDLDYHFTREKILPSPQHAYLLSKLCVLPSSQPPAYGGC
ncbi:transmembrane signal receptor [Lithospermum erythrorhizon]|uniref:Transmembrane signal receptor n=1 Tax=Lithospermum erythrorhizon TaxID=34254 RepID=A0AAV3NI07_LITER